MRVKMTASQTLKSEGSQTTLLAGQFYLLPDPLAERFIADGVAESDDARDADGGAASTAAPTEKED